MLQIKGKTRALIGDTIYAKTGSVTSYTGVITGITKANPAVVTDADHGLVTGDVITISGLTQMTELNNVTAQVVYINTSTFSLKTIAGSVIDSSGYGAAETTGGVWAGKQKIVSGITKANPAVVTSTAHGRTTGDIIRFSGLDEMTELNGREFTVVYIGANTFSLKDETGAAVNSLTLDYDAETTGGYFTILDSLGTGSFTLTLNKQAVTVDFAGAWNVMGFTYNNIVHGGYVISYKTTGGDVVAQTWMYMPAALFNVVYDIVG